jgi:hypothetical protein
MGFPLGMGRAEKRVSTRHRSKLAPKVVADSELCLGKSLLISILRTTVASESRMLWTPRGDSGQNCPNATRIRT